LREASKSAHSSSLCGAFIAMLMITVHSGAWFKQAYLFHSTLGVLAVFIVSYTQQSEMPFISAIV